MPDLGSINDWNELLRCYHFADEAEALAWPYNSVDQVSTLVQAGIPLVQSLGDADEVVADMPRYGTADPCAPRTYGFRGAQGSNDQAIRSRRSRAGLGVRLDKPQPLVDSTRNLREHVSRVGIFELAGFNDGVASLLPEG